MCEELTNEIRSCIVPELLDFEIFVLASEVEFDL